MGPCWVSCGAESAKVCGVDEIVVVMLAMIRE